MDYSLLEKASAAVSRHWPDARPSRGLICGSGWSDVVSAFEVKDSLDYAQIPGLGRPGVEGHLGRLAWGRSAGQETFIFQGRRHYYEGEGWTPVAVPLFLLKQLGASVVVLTNAAGGIRKDLKTGDLMVIDDHINLMGSNPLIGPHHDVWGPRCVDQTCVYDAKLRALADKAGRAAGVKLADGMYAALPGPSYETPAEIRALRALGADAVGMSTVPEAMLARGAGIRVLGLSCITNLAAGISPTPLNHDEVTAATKAAMPRMKSLLIEIWKELAHA
ncbi:MAG: purine-nucleoside phosphorylase [Verrucomicrobiota bacterium]